MNCKYFLFLILSLLLLTSHGFSMPQDDPAEAKGATKSHDSLKKLSPKLLKSLNLSEAEAANTTLGKKVRIYMIELDALNSYKAGDSAKKLVIDTKEISFPVYLDGHLKTALSIRKREGGWKNASFGSSEIAMVMAIRDAHAQENNIKEADYSLVRVPGLYLSFLGYYKKGDLYLIPLNEHPELNLVLGEAVPAGDLYLQMKPLVSKFKNLLTRP